MNGLFKICLVLAIMASGCNQNKLINSDLNSGWKFIKLKNEAKDDDYHQLKYDDSQWTKVSLPHTANIEPLIVNDQWQGICWYRKDMEVPNSLQDKKVFLEFEAAMNYSIFWINGVLVKEHHGGYLPVVMDATPYLKIGEKNSIAIRLDNRDNPVTGPKPLKILDFNMYGGLYRNAKMIVKDKIYISHPILADQTASGGVFITTPRVGKDTSVVKVKTHIINEGETNQSIQLINTIHFDNEIVATYHSNSTSIDPGDSMQLNHEFKVENAQLWSPKNPNLYYVKTELWRDGRKLDEDLNRFGIREFVFKENDLYINGEKTFLRGVNRHQEYPFIGYALSDNAQYRDAKKIKEAGFNYIRLSHYPQAPAFMDACDELGIIVLDAILGWQFYNDTDAFREYCYRSATDLIRRDRNHPCVLAWEVSLNESAMPIFFMEKLHKIVHEEFPGPNVFSCGWLEDVYDIYLQARQHRLLHYNEFQEKPYVVSEYGDWEYFSDNPGLNQHNYSQTVRIEKSSRQLRAFGESRLLQQAINIQEAHNDNLITPAFADSYWVMYDYNRGYADDIESSGIMDIFRIPKFAYYFYKSQLAPEDEVVVQIASYWTPESPLDLKVYSNCDEVALYLNDQLIVKQVPDTDSNSSNLAHPPFTYHLDAFEAGTLKAIGFIKGEKVKEHLVHTPQKATSLKIWLDESGRKPQTGCNDVLFLYVAAMDGKGTIVPDFSEIVHIKIEGNAEVMNVGEIIAEAGIATALIRIGEENSEIIISASAKELNGSVMKFVVE